MKLSDVPYAVVIAVTIAFVLVLTVFSPNKTVIHRTVIRRTVQQPAVTVYVVNQAQRYFPNPQIRKDIPSWELAANKDFAPVWKTPQVRIRLVRKAPDKGIVAVFKSKGPIQGALAFHNVERGIPHITVYSGVSRFYGYDISEDFTHELFELLADPTISQTNQGYPYPFYYIGQQQYGQALGTVWSNEVADPVEKYGYRVNGVLISDFVTPNWFNDHVSGPYDFMGVTQQPFQIAKGGYACFYENAWTCVQNFRHAGPDAAGFYKAENTLEGH